MTGLLMFLHAFVCIVLIVVILMQSGRGGGLTESFSSAESMFGTQTNSLMIKATTVFAALFLVTCLSLAVLSTQKGKSLMPNKVATQLPVSDVPAVDLPVADVPVADATANPTPAVPPVPTESQ